MTKKDELKQDIDIVEGLPSLYPSIQPFEEVAVINVVKALREREFSEPTDMDKLTTEMMEHICDNLCKHPCNAKNQDELDDTCAECKMGKFICDILNTHNHQGKILNELKENDLDPIEMCEVKMLIGEFLDYKRLQEQKLLHRLPCKTGETVYEILKGMIVPSMVTGFRIGKMMGEDEEEYEEDYEENTWYIQTENGIFSQSFPLSAAGTSFWFTREAAQQELDLRKNGRENNENEQ